MTDAQIAVLRHLAMFKGAFRLQGEEARTAISMAATKLLALGPDEADGSVVAMITREGRDLVAKPDLTSPVPADREGR